MAPLAKKDASLLGLLPTGADNGRGPGSLVAASPSRSLTREEQKLVEAERLHELTIWAYQRKALYGAAALGRVHVGLGEELVGTVGALVALKNGVQDPEVRAVAEEWYQHQRRLAAKHFSAALDAAGYRIGEVIHDPIEPLPEPPPPSWWKRLVG